VSSKLDSLLNNERAAVGAFIVLLEAEQSALLEGDTDKLLASVEEKNRSAAKLNDLSEQRRRALPSDVTNLNFDKWLQQHEPSGAAIWQDLRRLATQAHQLNQTNGELIQIKLRYNQQALGVLFGAAQNAAGLYGRDGQTNSLPSSAHIFGSV
jgi:flagella synthesis protein FlgN